MFDSRFHRQSMVSYSFDRNIMFQNDHYKNSKLDCDQISFLYTETLERKNKCTYFFLFIL